MSTLLQPVGPREPRVYWLRRAVIVGVPLILIIVIAESCSGGGGKTSGHKKPSTHVTTSAAASPTTTPTQTAAAAPSACEASKLTLTLSTDSVTYSVGQTPKFTGTFANPGTTDCSFTLSPKNEVWTVKSGTAQIWSTDGCSAATPTKAVTIKAGGHKKVSVTWDGRLQGTKCAVESAASAGEYTLNATLDGVTAPHLAVFHIA